MIKYILILLVILVSACGGNGIDEVDVNVADDLTLETNASNSNSGDGVNLDSFEIDPNAVDPSIDTSFQIFWEASNFGLTYVARMTFSLNTTLSDDDVEVFAELCTTDANSCAKSQFTTTCFFTTANIMSCNNLTGFGDLTPSLPTLPVDGFLILQLCDTAELNSCSIEVEPIRLL